MDADLAARIASRITPLHMLAIELAKQDKNTSDIVGALALVLEALLDLAREQERIAAQLRRPEPSATQRSPRA